MTLTDRTFLVVALGMPVPAYSCFVRWPVAHIHVQGAADEEAAAKAAKSDLARLGYQPAYAFDVIETTRITLDGGPLGAHLVADKPRPDNPTG